MNDLFPLSDAKKVYHNNSSIELIELSIRRNEGRFASTGALVVETGAHTGQH